MVFPRRKVYRDGPNALISVRADSMEDEDAEEIQRIIRRAEKDGIGSVLKAGGIVQ